MWKLTRRQWWLPAARHRVESLAEVYCRLLCSLSQPERTIVREGQAKIGILGNDVFYNKAQVVNRDLSIAVLQSFIAKRQEELLCEGSCKTSINKCFTKSLNDVQALNFTSKGDERAVSEKPCDAASIENARKPFKVLEAAAATGVRAIRYALEVDGIDSIVALDVNNEAVEACQQNIRLNGEVALSKVHAELGDARLYMASRTKQFNVVDLDPYGSPAVFLDSAVQSVADGGLLMCTATDMTVLCGTFGETCHSKYGSYAIHGDHCHEMAIRILLSSIESHANRYKRIIVPVMCVYVDFYVRVFVRIYTSPKSVKESPSKLSYVYQCNGCHSFHLQKVGEILRKDDRVSYRPGRGPPVLPLCEECGSSWTMGGPIWSNPLHDMSMVSFILTFVTESKACFPAFDKVHCLLTAVSEELHDAALYMNLHALSNILRCNIPPNRKMVWALANAGYRVSGSHANPLALKTDAPMHVIWDIMRCWVKQHPIKNQPDLTVGSAILKKEPTLQADFSKGKVIQQKKRFMPNPEKNWGPKTRAGRKLAPMESVACSRDMSIANEESFADSGS